MDEFFDARFGSEKLLPQLLYIYCTLKTTFFPQIRICHRPPRPLLPPTTPRRRPPPPAAEPPPFLLSRLRRRRRFSQQQQQQPRPHLNPVLLLHQQLHTVKQLIQRFFQAVSQVGQYHGCDYRRYFWYMSFPPTLEFFFAFCSHF